MDDKNSPTPSATEAMAPSARAHNAGDGGAVAGGLRRFSAKRKLTAVQRLMRGESLDAVSRDLNVPVHRLTAWRDKVLMGAESALKERERDARDDEIARLQAKVGEIGTLPGLLVERGSAFNMFDVIAIKVRTTSDPRVASAEIFLQPVDGASSQQGAKPILRLGGPLSGPTEPDSEPSRRFSRDPARA